MTNKKETLEKQIKDLRRSVLILHIIFILGMISLMTHFYFDYKQSDNDYEFDTQLVETINYIGSILEYHDMALIAIAQEIGLDNSTIEIVCEPINDTEINPENPATIFTGGENGTLQIG